jgi:bacillithiol synthase
MNEAVPEAIGMLAPARPRHLRDDLFARWKTALSEWEAPPRAVEAYRALQDARTRVVITGQQPGPWGGPLYTSYKAATALAVAEQLAARNGAPAVAVFWMQSEDTDWGEIGWGALPHRDLRLFRHRFDATVPARHWVGSARLTDPPEVRALVEEWGEAPERVLPGPEIYELGAAFARSLLARFGEHGLLPLDGRWPELRSEGAVLWERYLPRHQPLTREIVARGNKRGRDAAPLDEASASRGLFVLDGDARRPIDPGTWESEVSGILAAEPARLAPSVLLRAPLQDHLFGPVAHVVGRMEAAYLDQLQPVYAALQIEAPVRVPRLSATVLPKGLLPDAERERAIGDPEAWLAERAATRVSADARRILIALRGDLESSTARLAHLLGAEQESAESVTAARRKIDLELKRLEETLERRGRRELYREDPRLRHLPEFLRPRRGPQERGISAAMLPLLFGDAAPSVLLAAARDHVAAWPAGHPAPHLLEAARV